MFRKQKFIKQAEVKSEPYNPTLFPPNSINQSVNVTIAIDEKDDGIADCIKGCFSCCVSGAKIAAKG